MSLCSTVITQSDALAEAVLAYERERAGPGLSIMTARLRQRMVDAAHATQVVNDGARALLKAATAGLLPSEPAAPVAANDHDPEHGPTFA